MKQLLLGAILLSPSLWAGEPMETVWNQLCRNLGSHSLLVTTTDGATKEGYCISVSIDAVSIRTDTQPRPIQIARDRITALRMRPVQGKQLAKLGRRVRDGFKWGFESLLSADAIGGIVLIPATAAMGAISAPFCILGDLRADLAGTREIRLK